MCQWNKRSNARYLIVLIHFRARILMSLSPPCLLSAFFQYSVLISSLSKRARSIVRDLDPTNELTYLRLKSRKHEVLVAPDDEYILIVVQNPPAPLPQ